MIDSRPTTDEVKGESQTSWSRAQLIAMLKDRDAKSVRLILKKGDTEVQRVTHNGKVCVAKSYGKNLAANQGREVAFLIKSQSLDVGITSHIVPLVTVQNQSTLAQMDFYTKWGGFDLDQWHILLGANHPYMNTVPGLLSLVYGILDATYAFHAQGYVHNDLLMRNLIMDYRYDEKTNTGQLHLDTICMIDFEFTLPPRFNKRGVNILQNPIWLDQNDDEIILNPLFHSKYVCGFETELVLINKQYVQDYKLDEHGHCIPLQDAVAIRANVGFGADFFTLAYELRKLIAQATPYWSDDHLRKYEKAHDYLLALPDVLEAYNLKPDANYRPVPPHMTLMADIKRLVTVNPRPEFTLPKESFVQAEAAAPTMLNTDGKQTRAVKKLRTHWPLAAVIGIVSVTGAAWLMPNTAIDIKKKPIALLTDLSRDCRQQVDIAHTWSNYDANCQPSVKASGKIDGLPSAPLMVVLPSAPQGFQMGSPDSENRRQNDEGPVHTVWINYRFAMGKYALSFEEWDACYNDIHALRCTYQPDDNGWGRGKQPVTNVSADDIENQYLVWLNAKAGLKSDSPYRYRLPSEAEFEYTARAGTTTPFLSGEPNTETLANFLFPEAPMPVDSFDDNPFGIRLLLGNVWRWTQDCYNNYNNGAPTDGSAWISSCKSLSQRVLRGGNWSGYNPLDSRAAKRGKAQPDYRNKHVGAHLARTLFKRDLPGNLQKPSIATPPYQALSHFQDDLKGGGKGPEMVWLPAGEFDMGSVAGVGDDDERPLRQGVKVAAFALAMTEVTVKQYLVCVTAQACNEPEWREAGNQYHYQTGSSRNSYKERNAIDEQSPITGVSWKNAVQYAAWLSAATGQSYQLPSEAQWEYACKAGQNTTYCGSNTLADVAWTLESSGRKLHAVATRAKNSWDLRDMSGNAREWTQDCWHKDYKGAPKDASVRTGGDCNRHAGRGGSWISFTSLARSAIRYNYDSGYRYSDVGFRVARTAR